MSEKETRGTEAAIAKRCKLEFDGATTNLEASLVTRREFNGPVKLADVAPKLSAWSQDRQQCAGRVEATAAQAGLQARGGIQDCPRCRKAGQCLVARGRPAVLGKGQDSLPPETSRAPPLATTTGPSDNYPVPGTGPRSLSLAHHR